MPAPLIWHITERPVWEAAVRAGSYTQATRGRSLAQEGFIHASWPEQVSAVARRVYPERPADLVILEIDVPRLEAGGVLVDLGPEPAGGAVPSPRICGALPIACVLRLRRTRWIGREFVVVA